MYAAEVVGADAQRDVAVLAVLGAPPGALRPLPLGSSADVRVGQSAYAIGFPWVCADGRVWASIARHGRVGARPAGRRAGVGGGFGLQGWAALHHLGSLGLWA
jgi:hypothetical protein